jgi:hypothetical protein
MNACSKKVTRNPYDLNRREVRETVDNEMKYLKSVQERALNMKRELEATMFQLEEEGKCGNKGKTENSNKNQSQIK